MNLGDPKEYKILNQGSMTVDNVDDAKDFEEVSIVFERGDD